MSPEPVLPTSIDTIITHDGCMDGHTARWLLQREWPNAEWVPGIYGNDPPPPPHDDATLVLADFSYPAATVANTAADWAHIWILDHHQSAIADLAAAQAAGDLPDNVHTILDLDRSGAGIVADWLHERCRLVDYVEDRDLWRWNQPRSREVNAYIQSTEMTIANWDQLANLMGDVTEFNMVIRMGEAIRRRDEVIITELVAAARTMTIAGYAVPVTPSPYALGSDTAGRLAVGQPFAAYYRDLPDRREFGLRSTDDGVDVSKIAAVYGGGGHVRAAGFRVPWGSPLAARSSCDIPG